ncbi:MAG: hypothetical protein LBH48_00875 [Bifidobacteriaceae bacterium]|jgi:hypothetical protein|nr:hypothetical protein [Bifidobacteriaceae bacterium]
MGEMDAVRRLESVNRLLQAVKRDLGDSSTWDYVRFYPYSLALGTVDAIWSVRVRAGETIQIVARYAAYRRDQGADPDTDTSSDLLHTFDVLGVEGWTERIGNHQRTYASVEAPPKAEAVRRAAAVLVDGGIETPEDLDRLVAGGGAALRRVESAWRSIPGEASGLTWRRLGLVTGAYDLPPSPWLVHYIADAAPGSRTSQAGELLDEVALRLGVAPMALRQAIWHYESTSQPDAALVHQGASK